MKLLGVLCSALVATSAYSADLTVFGFELGKPLTLPECPFKMVGTAKLYDLTPAQTCTQAPIKINTYGQPVRRIIFSKAEAPDIVKNWQMIALEADGNLVGIEFFTIGAASQELVYQTLTQQYGSPTRKNVSTVGNGFGASAQAISASWVTKQIDVTFDGMLDRLDRGRVLIDTPEATTIRQQWDNADNSSRRTLGGAGAGPATPATTNSPLKLGVNYFPVDARFAQIAAMDSPRGVGVARVASDSVAAKSGLKVGDAILAVDGVPLPSSTTGLQEVMAGVKPGSLVNLTVWRSGREITVPVQF